MGKNLSHDQLRELHAAAIQAGLSRRALLEGIPAGFAASLPNGSNLASQLLTDLHALNRTGLLLDGSFPLQIWLSNAAMLTTHLPEGAVFERALQSVSERAATPDHPERAPIAVDPRNSPPRPDARGAPMETGKTVRIFVSASPKDARFVSRLEQHFAGAKRDGSVRLWHHGMLSAGANRTVEIERELEKADIVLAILSADYLAEDASYGESERAKRAGKRLVPVLARAVSLNGSLFAGLTAVPSNGVWISAWSDQDSAFVDVAGSITELAAQVAASRAGPSQPAAQASHSQSVAQTSPLHMVHPSLLNVEPESFWAHPNAARLHTLLMAAYDREPVALLLARRASLLTGHVLTGQGSALLWSSLLEEAVKQLKLKALMDGALDDKQITAYHAALRECLSPIFARKRRDDER